MAQALPLEIEEKILSILESGDPDTELALESIRLAHPEHSAEIARRLIAAERIRAQLSSDLTPLTTPDPRSQPQLDSYGPFHCKRLLGEGGMGQVFLAEQTEPVQRQVALKIVRPGMDSGHMLERFEQERQTLSRLTHGCIALILDAGTTEGQLWFAMEYIEGTPITEYCDRERLDLTARIELLCLICEAVHHAHQKGIIHRDIKPANLLVSKDGLRAVPKVIDFGLARLTQSMDDGGRRLTEAGTLLGTPEYMGPEQASSGSDAVDVRSDVYSLGVVLYELLVGCLPIDFKKARNSGVLAVQKLLSEAVPTRPSIRWQVLPDQKSLAALRNTQPARLGRALHSDLDWIAMRALAHEPDERYQSALALSEDLRRYQKRLPVEAGPPSTSYRVKKFVARNRLAVAAAVAVVASLIIGLVLSITFFIRAEDARIEMVAQRDEADRQATLYRTINAVLNEDLLAGASPDVGGDRDLKVRDALHYAERRLGDRFADAPLVEAELRASFGATYEGLGDPESAEPNLERAAALLSAALGGDDPRTLDVIVMHANVLRKLGHWERCRAIVDSTIPITARTLGEDHLTNLQLRTTLGLMKRDLGDLPSAARELAAVLDDARNSHFEIDPTDMASFASNLADIYTDQRRLDDAAKLFQDVIADLTEFSPGNVKILRAIRGIANVYQLQGKRKQAISMHRTTLARTEEIFGPEHPLARVALNDLGAALSNRSDAPEALEIFERLVELQRRDAPGQSNTLGAINNLARTYRLVGRMDEAEQAFMEVLQGHEVLGLANHINYFVTLSNLARVYEAQGELDLAQDAFERSLAGRRSLDPSGRRSVSAMRGTGQFYLRHELWTEAVVLLTEALDLGSSFLPANHKDMHRIRLALGEAHLKQRNYVEAEAALLPGAKLVADDAGQRGRYATLLVTLYEAWDRPEQATRWGK